MKISFVKAAGFRGIKKEVSIPLPDGFVIISGRNGSGKTTICDVIEFALTGRLERYAYETERGENAADYIWWRGKGSPNVRYVSIGLKDEDGKEVSITRTPETPFPVEPNLEKLLCSGPSPKESLQQLCQTSFIRDEMITRWSLDLPETERFNFVREAIGIVDFSFVEDKIKEIINILNQQKSDREREYAEARARVSDVTSNLSEMRSGALLLEDIALAEKELRTSLNKWSGDIPSLLGEARESISGMKIRIGKVTSLLNALRDLLKRKSDIETPDYVHNLRVLREKIQNLERRLTEVKERRSDIERNMKCEQDLHPRISSLAQLYEHGVRLGLESGNCPLCGSKVSKVDFEKHLQEIQYEVEVHAKSLSSLVESQTQLVEVELNLQNELNSDTKNFVVMNNAAEYLKNEFTSLKGEAASLGIISSQNEEIHVDAILEAIEQERVQSQNIERNLALLESSIVLDRITDLERELAIAKKESTEREADLRKVEKTAERIKDVATIVKRISGEIIDENVAALSPLLSELYSRLRPHVDWPELKYNIRGDIRRFLSLKIGDNLNPKFMFSSGQRRAVGLVFLIAIHLARPWCKLKALILDDPVQHIDDFRALHLVELLSSIRQTGQQIICTVEDTALADLLCRRLRSSERNEGCRVELEYQPEEGVSVKKIREIYAFPKEVILSA